MFDGLNTKIRLETLENYMRECQDRETKYEVIQTEIKHISKFLENHMIKEEQEQSKHTKVLTEILDELSSLKSELQRQPGVIKLADQELKDEILNEVYEKFVTKEKMSQEIKSFNEKAKIIRAAIIFAVVLSGWFYVNVYKPVTVYAPTAILEEQSLK